MNLLKLNKSTETSDYNCGGFALGNHEWYIPESLEDRENWDNVDNMISKAVNDILNDFPNLKRIPYLRIAPKDKDIVGFRIAYSTEDNGSIYEEDFHFILRHAHKWYHKQGSSRIARVDFNMQEEWPRAWGMGYNSQIIWFVKT